MTALENLVQIAREYDMVCDAKDSDEATTRDLDYFDNLMAILLPLARGEAQPDR